MGSTSPRRLVVKIGTSSITAPSGAVDPETIARLSHQVAELLAEGVEIVVVTSGAITAGLPAMGLDPDDRPTDVVTLQAVSSVGQIHLMGHWSRALGRHGRQVGQVLLSPLDFTVRRQYLHARATLIRMLELGVVPVVNENDALADDEIRYGDNDRIAALVAHLLDAELLLLLTDAPGVLTADPRLEPSASLIEEVTEADALLEASIGGPSNARGSGGMGSKIAAARMAAWSGVRSVIAAADRPSVVRDALEGVPGVGTRVAPRSATVPARKLWIGFAAPASGRVTIDAGAVDALVDGGRSLLLAGVVDFDGEWVADEAVEVLGPDGVIVAKGLTRMGSQALAAAIDGRGGSTDRPDGTANLLVHRDDLLVFGVVGAVPQG